LLWHIHSEVDQGAEKGTENCEVSILLGKESIGTLVDELVDLLHTCLAFLRRFWSSFFFHFFGINLNVFSIELNFSHHRGVDSTPYKSKERASKDNVMRVCALNNVRSIPSDDVGHGRS
jgi:hypothetical protein